ncbi:TM2 domain-containing protein [Erysipelothrix inopinata]|nr:TM2 domain-containing protein [Erysipelothrix inopinata]
MSKCQNCGAPMEDGICTYCNYKESISNESATIVNNSYQTNYNTSNYGNTHGNSNVSPKGKWPTFALCLFLGVFGFHRFYVGKIGTGILYFFTAGFCGFGVLVDCVVILAGAFKDGNGLPVVQ